ncbi:MAG: DUF167 family protein [Alphaproteobacteria bacterium]|nr:DUF167 family protein [Alphaproteobacteria bacterium]MDP6872411.1 DUF167 family protein [Alphaproteobacteria bacterium]
MPFRVIRDGVAVAVRLRPGASANRIDGIQTMADGARRLQVRVTAVPEKGKANQALIKLLAKAWRVPRGSLSVIVGAKDRDKSVLLQGDGGADVKFLQRWLLDEFPEGKL